MPGFGYKFIRVFDESFLNQNLDVVLEVGDVHCLHVKCGGPLPCHAGNFKSHRGDYSNFQLVVAILAGLSGAEEEVDFAIIGNRGLNVVYDDVYAAPRVRIGPSKDHSHLGRQLLADQPAPDYAPTIRRCVLIAILEVGQLALNLLVVYDECLGILQGKPRSSEQALGSGLGRFPPLERDALPLFRKVDLPGHVHFPLLQVIPVKIANGGRAFELRGDVQGQSVAELVGNPHQGKNLLGGVYELMANRLGQVRKEVRIFIHHNAELSRPDFLGEQVRIVSYSDVNVIRDRAIGIRQLLALFVDFDGPQRIAVRIAFKYESVRL